jgi:hypothetical protein
MSMISRCGAQPAQRALGALSLFILCFVAAGCAAEQPADAALPHGDLRTQGQALRPEHVDQSYDSPGGHARVWWATSGEHAPPMTDADQDGVPDFVSGIAQTADAVIGWLDTHGWRLALSDQALNDGSGFGGDDRFDIYLENFRAGDGHRVVEACEERPNGVRHCAGYFVMENDFAEANYPSIDEAIQVLVSHEYFHTIQDAYQADIPAWWSEGSATWFEEAFNPAQLDFEGLAGLYLSESDRSLLGYIRGPSDSFSYAASLYVYFLALHIGDDGMRGVFERLDQGQPLLPAIEAGLAPQFPDLGASFRAFASWNVLTASRAVAGFGYPQASGWRGLTLTPLSTAQPFNWDRQVEAFAADYAALTVERPALLAIEAVDGWSQALDLMLVRVNDPSAGAQGVELTHLRPGDAPVTLTPGPKAYVVLVNGALEGKAAGRVTLRHVDDTASPPPDGDDIGGGSSSGSDSGCQATRPSSPAQTPWGGWLIVGLVCALSARRRARLVQS